MAERVLVTGGAGYLGSVMVPALLAEGYHVTVLDNFMYGQSSLAACCAHENFQIVRGDVRVESTMAPLMAKADIVIPLAALVGAPLCNRDPVGARTTNHDAPLMMLRLASRHQMILMPTTNSGYGTAASGGVCDENTALNPISTYASDKAIVEKAILERENSISFRLATVFGMSPRMRLDLLVNDFVYRACKDQFIVLFESHFRRNYIHIRDVSQVFLFGLSGFEKMRGQVFNVGLSNANLSKRQLCEKIKAHLHDFVFLEADVGKDPDQRDYIVSNEKIESAGFHPRYSLDHGIRELISGYQMITNTKYGNC